MGLSGHGKKQTKKTQKASKTIKGTKGTKSRATKDGLNPRKYSRIKQEYFEVDYIAKLSESEKEWLANFQYEELGANVKEAKLNKSKKDKRRIYNENNARNRDTYSISKATNRIIDLNTVLYNDQDNIIGGNSYEEELIAFIDSKKVKIKN